MAERFRDRVILITGAAGGIGRATALRFASEGAAVVATDLPGEPLDALAKELASSGVPAEVLPLDVTQSGEWHRAVERAESAFGGLDHLFNNAGIEGFVGAIDVYPEETLDQVLAVNVKGVFLGIQHAVPALRRRGGGVIVNTASVAGLMGDPNIPAYIASKHAVLGITKSAAIGYGPERIRVNAVCPAPIETRMMRSLERGLFASDPEVAKQMLHQRIPLGRYGEPEEVASLVAFLCSDEARYITGSAYTIDGGMTTY
jgi:NAD(P)-dependent dehydrogenase (short-subunit alcohol dehydrogenase family)